MAAAISVVMPVFNGERYLAKAVESVLAQTYPVHEIVIINDGSTDSTAQVIADFGGKVVAKHIPNGGVANAMTLGTSLATGDHIAYLDHDDVWFRDKLERQLKALEANPSARFSCCNFAVRPAGLNGRMTEHFSRLKVHRRISSERPLLRHASYSLVQESFVGTSSTVLVHRDIVRQVGSFNGRYRICGDYDYWLRCSALTDFVVVDRMLLYKRTHGTNISSNTVQMYLEHIQILEGLSGLAGFFDRDPRLRGEHRRQIANMWYLLGDLHFSDGRVDQAFECYRNGIAASRDPRERWIGYRKYLSKQVRRLTR